MLTEAEDFLRAFHAGRPAVTGESFRDAPAADGRSSYQVLRDRVGERRRVLDLGCGDGVLLELLVTDGHRHGGDLAGIDLSREALALADRRPALAGAVLAECRAQRLPFAGGSFDACVSHMALMLMDDVEQVAEEAARVLVPGGLFACAVGGGAAGGEAYELFLDLVRPVLREMPRHRRMPALGDPRTRTREGLDEVLGPAGFAPVAWQTIRIDLGGTPEQVWSSVSGIYDLYTVDARTVARLRRSFLAEAARLAPRGEPTPCGIKVHVATARRG